MLQKTQKNIKIEKVETRYIISDVQYSISVIISGDGQRMSVYNRSSFDEYFNFTDSEPECIEAIAKLILEAVKLTKNLSKEIKISN